MIIIFTSSIGVIAVLNKKRQLSYINDLIYMADMVLLMLKSTIPETDAIFNKLSNDSRLKNFDFSFDKAKLILKNEDYERVMIFYNSIGRYDTDCLISITNEFSGYFKMLNQQYQNYYNAHYKLYILFGLFSGIVISVLLM